MSLSAGLAAAILLLASTASAQTTRDDGIRALVGGDYQAAARILRALGENSAQPDPVAQFLLAILYDTGHGVARDEPRACGLFSGGAAPASPFMQQSSVMSSVLLTTLGPLGPQLCVPSSKWHDVPAAAFTLGPGHRVVVADNSVTVTDNGAEQRVVLGTLPGALSLPLRYTPLDVLRPVAVRRHFFQWFIWMPDVPNAPSAWTLGWVLYEVVGS